MNAFEEAYGRLNEAQKEAVDTIDGPVMVIAGPGTGKTQILTLRIANILKQTDTPASAILALTYTEAGVSAMRERLASFIGGEAYAVRIHTYHSFAESLISEYGSYLPRLRDGVLVDDVDQREVLERAFDSVSVPLLTTRANPYRALSEVSRFIDEAKRELYTPEKLREEYKEDEVRIKSQGDFVHEKGAHKGKIKGEYVKALQKIEKNLQATDVFEAYEKILQKEQKYDFQDLLLDVVSALKEHEEFKLMLQESFHYFLADEHQDANATQNEILLLLSDFHENPNVFVVGDEKQAIYRFQGADLDTFLTLKERYPESKVILLDTNYRSSQEVLDAAHTLIGKAPIPDPSLRKELTAHHGNNVKVSLLAAEDYEKEINAVISYIQDKVDSGVALEDIAVLVRNNKDAFPIANACFRAGIPYALRAKENALEHAFSKLYIHLLKGIWDFDPVSLSRALFIPGIVEDATERLRVIEVLRNKEDHETVGVFKELHEEVHALPAVRAIPHILSKCNVISGVASRFDAAELYVVLEALLSDMEKFSALHPGADIGEYLDRLTRIQKHELSVVSSKKKTTGVQILTAHSAKGLEFPYVVIPFATDRRYGSKRASELSIPGSFEAEEHDERRLLYVALTRAEKEACITYAKKNSMGRSETPSRFIYDMEELLEDMNVKEINLPLLAEEKEISLIDPEFIKERLLTLGLSATAYGNYKASPWKYFFRNLIRLPEGKTIPLIYGSAIHRALEEAGKQAFKGEEISIPAVLSVFENEMQKAPLTEKEKEEHIPSGKELLEEYLGQASFAKEGAVEFSVSVPFEVPGVGEVLLKGNLDRIDVVDGGVVVLDYKTGAPKSENQIRGLTAEADPSYYVQLMFYALLLKHDPQKRYHMKEGVLEFVEKNQTGKYVSRRFVIDEKELEEFEEELKKDIADIANGALISAPPADEYLELIEMLMKKKESDQ
ncbi:MAG: ATP-dependent helicase [Patescibacteria group bacterium UBA2103]